MTGRARWKTPRSTPLVLAVTIASCGAPAAPRADAPPRVEPPPHVSPLSEPTRSTLGGLEHELEITAYFTSHLPAPFDALEPRARALLEAYQRAGGEHVRLRFVDPRSPAQQREAEAAGVPQVLHQHMGEGSLATVAGYRGVVLGYAGAREVIPVVERTRGLEYEITRRVRALVRGPRPIGVVIGHGGPSASEGLRRVAAELVGYTLRDVDLASDVDPELVALLVIDPSERFDPDELRRLGEHVARGGALGVFGGAMGVSLEGMRTGAGPSPTASPVDTGLDALLSSWGLALERSLVADTRCVRVPMRSSAGIPIPVPFPPVPIASLEDVEHPLAVGSADIPFFFVSPIRVSPRFGQLGGVVLARSSRESWLLTGESVSLEPREPGQWPHEGPEGAHVLLAVLDHAPGSRGDGAATAGSGRVLVSGTAGLLRDEYAPAPPAESSALTLGIDAIEWLAGEADLPAMRERDLPR